MTLLLSWQKSDGTTPLAEGATLTSGTTYYAEIQVGSARDFGLTVIWDAAIIITSIALESTCKSSATAYAAVGSSGWQAEAALGSTSAAGGSASSFTFSATGATSGRYRAKAVIGGTGGVLTGEYAIKGG